MERGRQDASRGQTALHFDRAANREGSRRGQQYPPPLPDGPGPIERYYVCYVGFLVLLLIDCLQ